MAYRKFKADLLFTGTEIVSKKVLVADEQGIVLDLVNEQDAGTDIETYTGILSPGFVNCHCHLELSHLKGKFPQQSGMTDFLIRVTTQRIADPELILEAMKEAEKEMINEGIVAIGDICNTIMSAQIKESSSLYYHSFIEVAGVSNSIAEKRYAQAVAIRNQLERISRASIVPHAPYSVSPALMSLIVEDDKNEIVSIHNQESKEEIDFFQYGTSRLDELFRTLNIDTSSFQTFGDSALVYFVSQLKSKQRLILVHNVESTDIDIESLNDSNVYWCVCPNANLYITGNLPPIELLQKSSASIVVGTDSFASNHRLSILSELQTIKAAFPEISTVDLLRWATLNGARCLEIDQQFGSFEKGKKPGIVLIQDLLEMEIGPGTTVKRII